MFSAVFDEEWSRFFDFLDNDTRAYVSKKISKILEFPKKRHLKGNARFFVAELGQYRIVYRVFEEFQQVRFYFVGNHKEYEKWYAQYF